MKKKKQNKKTALAINVNSEKDKAAPHEMSALMHIAI